MAIQGRISVNFEKIAFIVNGSIPIAAVTFGLMGYFLSFYFHFFTVFFIILTLMNFHYRHLQTKHALLRNFGLLAQARYMIESVGPEFRQYLFMNDTEEKPFNRIERSEVYQKAKGVDSSSSFGSQLPFGNDEIKIRHSLFPLSKGELKLTPVIFGEERGIDKTYSMPRPIIISAMSYGALGERAIRSLARGAKKAGIAMNTGEGGYPKYHLMEGCDLIFQIGTAKFGVRDDEGNLDEGKLKEIADHENVKMIEIKLSQGAKPGKGGLLPKEKITDEISGLRGVPQGKDVLSPPHHSECTDATTTVDFIRKVQDASELPVGIKLCLGKISEFKELIQAMKSKNIYPDYIAIDGAEGGTGAAPKSFMDDLGVPLFKALPIVNTLLKEEGIRDKLKILCAGKLVNPGKQFMAFSMGADAVYTARGFMMAIGCIQALQCNQNTCPVGITTHDKNLQNGLDIDKKSDRVANYVNALMRDYEEMLGAVGKRSISELDEENLFLDGVY